MKDNIKKTSRLVYVISLSVISYWALIGSGNPNYSSIGETVRKALEKSMTNHYFIACYKPKYRKNILKKECFGRETMLQIKGQLVHIDSYYKYSNQFEALKKFNDDVNEKFTYEYSNDNKWAYHKAKKLNPKIIWVLFLISLPLIWFSRNVSILIVNGTMSIFKKGWKKI